MDNKENNPSGKGAEHKEGKVARAIETETSKLPSDIFFMEWFISAWSGSGASLHGSEAYSIAGGTVGCSPVNNGPL